MTRPFGPDRPARAPYGADPSRVPKRLFAEPPSAHRNPFQRDRDRILHSTAFRRLALKTQVLLPEEGDHHRTRLTHTLEVAQIGRSLARTLGFDEDLTEALALAHDFGHSPFGHAGEDALGRCLAAWGGFDHNVQTLRVVVDLEQRYLDFDGLNLTWDTLEGLAKRNGPVADPPALLRDYEVRLDLGLDLYPGGEAQLAAVADDIAYNAHDLEDGLRAGLIGIAETDEVPIIRALRRSVEAGRDRVDPARLPFCLARGLIDLFVTDVVEETRRRLSRAAPADIDRIRALGHPVASLSAERAEEAAAVKAFLFGRMYRHPHVLEMRAHACRVVTDLAELLLAEPAQLPDDWRRRATAPGTSPAGVARLVSDYIAGMTDRYAVREHRRLFDATPDFV